MFESKIIGAKRPLLPTLEKPQLKITEENKANAAKRNERAGRIQII